MSEVQRDRGNLAKFNPKKIKITPNSDDSPIRKGEWHWSHTLMLVGLFVGVIVSVLFIDKTLITWTGVLRLYLICALTGLLVPYRMYRKLLRMELTEVILSGVIGVGPCLMALIFMMNYIIAFNPQEYTYQVQHLNKVESGRDVDKIELMYNTDKLDDYPRLRTFDLYNDIAAIDAGFVKYTYKSGLFGMETVRDIEFSKGKN